MLLYLLVAAHFRSSVVSLLFAVINSFALCTPFKSYPLRSLCVPAQRTIFGDRCQETNMVSFIYHVAKTVSG